MRLLKILGGLLALILVGALGFYAWLGGFRSVQIERGVFGPAEIVYSTHRGPYEKIGKSWEEFSTAWQAAGLDACDSLAVYLDPPDAPKESLRSIIACRIDGLPEDEQAKWRASFPGVMLPQSDALISEFPFKNYASFILAPMKVYPHMAERMERDNLHGALAIEEYGVDGAMETIRIIMPIGVNASAYQPLRDAF
ncbi:hypothetical protein [Hyphococcus sp.]|uniref:hypothetical protein n=1 Tax=Hyphococcus sp. TaxID=2038636 RepID=UPI003CCBB172